MKQVLSDSEAAVFMGLAPRSLRNARSKGAGPRPPFVRVGRRIVYQVSDLLDYMGRHRIDPEGESEARSEAV